MLKSFPRQTWHRAASLSVSITLGPHGPLVASRVQLPFSILECRASDKKAVGTICKVLSRPGFEPATVPIARRTL